MPVIRYTLSVESKSLVETDTFERTNDPQGLIQRIIVDPLAANRKRLNEPEISLTKVEILNPHVHQHTWEKTHVSRFTLRTGYRCAYCGITGYKRFNVVTNQELQKVITRDESFQKEKFALCKDALKEMPKKLTFK